MTTMGVLIRQGGALESRTYLCREHTIGRDPSCDTVLSGPSVSRFHTRLDWCRDRWILRDLGSRNGTYVNGLRSTGGTQLTLKTGDQILFGDVSESWTLDDSTEPHSLLIPQDAPGLGAKVIRLHDMLALPSATEPSCTIFGTAEGAFELEQETGARVVLGQGQQLTIAGTRYMVHLAEHPGETAPGTRTADELADQKASEQMRLEIKVAPDEESAAVTLHHGSANHVLQPRVHFYLLAHLARLRVAEAATSQWARNTAPEDAESLARDDWGWIDCKTLCRDLRIEPEYLTQQVFRIRQDFKKINPQAANKVVDRRLRGRMRIGFAADQLAIRPLD